MVLVVSLAVHVGLFAALVGIRGSPPAPTVTELPPIPIVLMREPPRPEPLAPQAAPKPPSTPPARRRAAIRRPSEPPRKSPLAAAVGPTVQGPLELGPEDLAGAAVAGGGGRGCDMIGLLQTALRRSALVQSAVAEADGRGAILVWNGEWVRRPGQDGNGLAAIREAIMWEVGFAPAACRAQPVHGLVLLSMNDNPDGARLVMGAESWRWSDLLGRQRR